MAAGDSIAEVETDKVSQLSVQRTTRAWHSVKHACTWKCPDRDAAASL